MFKKFLPARQAVEVKVVADLDRLISESIGFMLHGVVRRIKPITQERFLKISNELAALDMIRMSKDRDPIVIKAAYLKLFKQTCEPFSDEDLAKMTDAQIGALVSQIIECVTGRAQASGEKKSLLIR